MDESKTITISFFALNFISFRLRPVRTKPTLRTVQFSIGGMMIKVKTEAKTEFRGVSSIDYRLSLMSISTLATIPKLRKVN